MAEARNWVVAARPLGRKLREDDFRCEANKPRALRDGEVRVRTEWLGFDPAQKSWMENIAGYAEPVEIGDVMPGQAVGVVTESQSARFSAGAKVVGPIGWREVAEIDASKLVTIPEGVASDIALGLLGTTGKSAYLALLKVGRPKAGDTLVVSGAAGGVGSIVGQIGKTLGCRVIGIAGGADKCAALTGQLGFDAAIDYKNERVRSRLRELCPKGIDIFFDNVGGEILDDALARLAVGARVVICGGISRYNADPRDAATMPAGPRNYFNLVFTGATMQGFLLPHYASQFAAAEAQLADWAQTGRLRQLADVQRGFENAPGTLMRLFEGRNLGKQLLQL